MYVQNAHPHCLRFVLCPLYHVILEQTGYRKCLHFLWVLSVMKDLRVRAR